jgi:hypothetical protein
MSMTKDEKQVLYDLVTHIQNLTVTLHALQSGLVHKGLLVIDVQNQEEAKYVDAAIADLAPLRTSIHRLQNEG